MSPFVRHAIIVHPDKMKRSATPKLNDYRKSPPININQSTYEMKTVR